MKIVCVIDPIVWY